MSHTLLRTGWRCRAERGDDDLGTICKTASICADRSKAQSSGRGEAKVDLLKPRCRSVQKALNLHSLQESEAAESLRGCCESSAARGDLLLHSQVC